MATSKPIPCKAEYCSSIYYSKSDLQRHQDLMHKNMIQNAAIKVIAKVISDNPELADKKVFTIPNFDKCSYKEMQEKISLDTDEGRAIKRAACSFVQTLLDAEENRKIADLWRLEYRIE